MKVLGAIASILIVACSSGQSSTPEPSSPQAVKRSPAVSASAAPVLVDVPPVAARQMSGGCGMTAIYKGGLLPDWATINAPKDLPYVVATPGLAVGYLFTFPMKSGLDANTKILWYVGTPRDGFPLNAAGHPVGATSPTAQFSKAADSFPGEIYPSGPTVPSSGCWHFSLMWHGGDEHADVDLPFQ
jgi:hypothetical protein